MAAKDLREGGGGKGWGSEGFASVEEEIYLSDEGLESGSPGETPGRQRVSVFGRELLGKRALKARKTEQEEKSSEQATKQESPSESTSRSEGYTWH